MVTLKELAQQVNNSSLQDLMENEELIDYIDRIDEVGADIMRNQFSYELMKCASEMIGANTLVHLLGEIDPKLSKMLLSNPTDFMKITMLIIKFSVGLAAIEELH